MTRSEFIEKLEHIERGFPVTRWTVRGLRVWPLVRLSLYSSTFHSGSPRHGLGAAWHQRVWNVAGGLSRWARAYLLDHGANRRPTEPSDAVFLTYSTGRRPLLAGKRYDVRAGPFIELLRGLGARSLIWEMSPFGDYNTPRYTPSFLLQPHLVSLRAACQLLPLGEDDVRLERYDEFVARVTEAGLRFAHADVGRIRRDVLFLRRLADRFRRWLGRSRPRLGFVANTGLPEQAFCLACRELGITSVELQHGVQGDLHPSYGSWFAVPEEGWGTRARIFWNWDEESAAAINRWALRAPDRHAAVVGGDPWREMWMNDDSDLVRRSFDLIENRKRAAGGDRHILVTLSSQGDAVPSAVLEAVRRSPPDWRYWFRLHQVDQSARRVEAARLLAPLGVDLGLMEFATEAPLHALLRRLDCHLTVSLSTVVAEAAAHGLPSVACGEEAAAFFRVELSAGLLTVASTPAEILAALHRFLGQGRRRLTPGTSKASAVLQRLLDGNPVTAAPVVHPGV
ncbi:MAG: hypothetical protein H0X69_03430 [Gemmatimonadales bacterium]|nr:hypothetical protein [Gemmatimonadales bacterium]